MPTHERRGRLAQIASSRRKAGTSLGKATKRIQREQDPPYRAREVLVGVLVLAGLVGNWIAPISAFSGPTHGTSTILPRV